MIHGPRPPNMHPEQQSQLININRPAGVSLLLLSLSAAYACLHSLTVRPDHSSLEDGRRGRHLNRDLSPFPRTNARPIRVVSQHSHARIRLNLTEDSYCSVSEQLLLLFGIMRMNISTKHFN